MTNKKTDKQNPKTKSAITKPVATKAAQPADAKKTAAAKTAVKTEQPTNTKKPVAAKTAPIKTESTGAKKPSAEKPAVKAGGDVTKTSNEKPAAAKSDVKKPTPPKVEVSAPPSKPAKNAPAKPEANEALRLAMQAMNHFITSKQEKSMAHFYHTVAKAWQKITTVEKLNSAFSSILSDSADWGFLKEVSPQLIKDGLSDRGDWVVVGVYPTKPKKLIFDQIFVHEDSEWKLAELKLYIAD